jgi:short-subunit dehydrogenase
VRTPWGRALVTGASSGIGEAIARRLAAAGTDLVLVARNRERLATLAGELADEHGVDTEVLAADLADRAQLARVEKRVGSGTEPVDLLVNNAGFGYGGPFGDRPADDEDAEIQVNVVALMRLTHAAVSRLRATPSARPGGILLVSSTASFEPIPGTANYAATKAYVTSLGQSLHEELRHDGIVVTTVCPGLTRTEFHARAGREEDAPDWAWQSADEVARAALSALDARRALVVPGLLNKSLQVYLRMLPASVARRGIAARGRRNRR